MNEILWHGRGGQGAFTAARLLGAAASLSGDRYTLAFPSFGPERRGAPMRAFTKVSDRPIGDRSAIALADFVVYLDSTLFSAGWENELKPGGIALVNLGGAALDAALKPTRPDLRVVGIDADAISADILGRPIPNTVFLGVLAALGVVSLADVEHAIEQYMAPKLHATNKEIVRAAAQVVESSSCDAFAEENPSQAVAAVASARAYEKAAAIDAAAGLSREDVDAVVDTARPELADTDVTLTQDFLEDAAFGTPSIQSTQTAVAQRPAQAVLPLLRDDARRTTAAPALDPSAFARTTCFEAGHLVAKNAGWRNIRPVLSPGLCTGCLQCYLYCPDGTVFKTQATKEQLSASDSAVAAVAIDYDFCKGCGICARVCKFNAIAMVPESDALEAAARGAVAVKGGAAR